MRCSEGWDSVTRSQNGSGRRTLRGVDSLVENADVPGPIRVRSTRIGEAHRDVDLAAMTRRAGGLLGKGRGVDLHSPASEVRLVFSE